MVTCALDSLSCCPLAQFDGTIIYMEPSGSASKIQGTRALRGLEQGNNKQHSAWDENVEAAEKQLNFCECFGHSKAMEAGGQAVTSFSGHVASGIGCGAVGCKVSTFWVSGQLFD
jgi:hypothetical protein